MKRYYAKSVQRLNNEAGVDAAREAAQVLTRLRNAPKGNALERALFRVLDAALKKQAERLKKKSIRHSAKKHKKHTKQRYADTRR